MKYGHFKMSVVFLLNTNRGPTLVIHIRHIETLSDCKISKTFVQMFFHSQKVKQISCRARSHFKKSYRSRVENYELYIA